MKLITILIIAIGLVALFLEPTPADASKDHTNHPIVQSTVYEIIGKFAYDENHVLAVTLPDGTRCVIYHVHYGGGIDCDFVRSGE